MTASFFIQDTNALCAPFHGVGYIIHDFGMFCKGFWEIGKKDAAELGTERKMAIENHP
jgi:hypothetical protein